MPRIGLTRAGIVFPIAAFLERIDVPVGRLLAEAGIPAWTLRDPEALIPTASVARLLTGAARTEGIANLGLLVGREAGIETLGVYGRVIRGAPTLGDALGVAVRHYRAFSSNGHMWIELVGRGDTMRVCHAFARKREAVDEWQQAIDYISGLMVAVIRLAAGATWEPALVDRQSDDPLAFRAVATAVALPHALCARPLASAPAASHVSDDDLRAWEASAPADDFVQSILQVVEMMSWEGYPDVHQTANVLGMSVRTLQRQLAEAGVTHESLVGRARFATAATLLGETNAKVLEIALDLGYSDHAHFTRAFRRWAGCSPQEYRRRHIAVHYAPETVRERHPRSRHGSVGP